MKRVVSVSLGSSSRNHQVETEILGQKFLIKRIGTDGNLELAIAKIQELDGKVDAFGMGGIDLHLFAGEKKYMLRDAKKLKDAAKQTPIVDGSGLKNTLERKTIEYLDNQLHINLSNKKVLLVCGVDRFGMAKSLEQFGAKVIYGDLIFGLGLPIPIKSLKNLESLAKIVIPLISQLPFEYLYPTGKQQERIINKFGEYYQDADIIAGDFLFIKKHLPLRLQDKIIVTNTVTINDIELLKLRGVSKLITTTPDFQGRSFGTNVLEAIFVALKETNHELSTEEYFKILNRVELNPRVIEFAKEKLA
ncbi:hypothetical protein SAMN00017405_2374 [Desulfonispora thiosulfatigenes DSM 11270]|uniref:Quinate 5-dehydrogenase n=1 Tax=Desulfonispora thiosulfatigenes DSM 11270 TaxID=656914 RepID=A0A1W1UU84_DESTI|nr:quinate 5-dehydrogenase [Desulfonispora thiosulfatigenes]SMB84610.1 hypothetical protein SAMN00017405_2374 [Desulfonispora thiosulfatigenes DSM 11270]